MLEDLTAGVCYQPPLRVHLASLIAGHLYLFTRVVDQDRTSNQAERQDSHVKEVALSLFPLYLFCGERNFWTSEDFPGNWVNCG